MRVFNADVTAYPGIALPLYSHGYLIALVLSLETVWETALGGVLLSPFMISIAENRIVLGNVSS